MMKVGSCGSSKSEAEIAHSEMRILSLTYIIFYSSVQMFVHPYFEMIAPSKKFSVSYILWVFLYYHNGQNMYIQIIVKQ